MRKITWRLVIGLLTFGIGVAVAMWSIGNHQRRAQVEMPAAALDVVQSSKLPANINDTDEFEVIVEVRSIKQKGEY